MNYRKGDVVTVTGTVKYDQGDDERVFVEVGHDDLWLKTTHITLKMAKFEIDDWVIWDGGLAAGECGQIVGISGDHAWIDMGSGNYCTRYFGAIERGPEHQPETPREVSDVNQL